MAISTLVHETANNPGTSVTVNLVGAVTSRRSFASSFSSGASCYYVITDGAQSEWGLGTFTAGAPNTLSRTTVIGNSAGTYSRLNFTGIINVYNSLPGEVYSYTGSNWAIVGGSANTLIATVPVTLRTLAPGYEIQFIAANTNTAAATLNINSLGALNLTRSDTNALTGGEVVANMPQRALYDGTRWRLMNAVAPSAVSTLTGSYGPGSLALGTSPTTIFDIALPNATRKIIGSVNIRGEGVSGNGVVFDMLLIDGGGSTSAVRSVAICNFTAASANFSVGGGFGFDAPAANSGWKLRLRGYRTIPANTANVENSEGHALVIVE